ncbi:MAG: sulfotransferase [Pseudomonadota bacterium]|nr:sulfotransferase [Pseudomonadota bacterium]
MKTDKFARRIVQINLPGKGSQPIEAGKALHMAETWIAKRFYSPAITLLNQLIKAIPTYDRAWIGLFSVYEKNSDWPQLEQAATTALQQVPKMVPALLSLAVAKRQLQKYEQAINSIEKAIKLEPKLSELHNVRGIIYKELGQKEEALRAFKRALTLKPSNIAALWNQSDLVGVLDQQQASKYLSLADSGKLSARNRAKVYYALARSAEAQQDYTQEYELVNKGATLMNELSGYDHAKEMAQTEQIRTQFSAQTEAASIATSKDSAASTPIFICGLPRSGTTLVEQIISSHLAVIAGDELSALPLAAGKLLSRKRLSDDFPLWANKLDAQDWQTLGELYIQSTQSLQSQRYFTDKNLMNYKAIGVIRRALPQAKIIVCHRNKADNLWGCYRQYFADGLSFTYDLDVLGDVYDAFEDLVDYWKQSAGPNESLLDIQYESLVENPEQQIKRLLEYLGLEWDEACLSFHQNRRAVRTTSSTQVRQPLSASKVGYASRYPDFPYN